MEQLYAPNRCVHVCMITVLMCMFVHIATSIDHSLIRQTFEFGKSISTVEKSILNLIQLLSLVAKYCKIGKI